MDEAGGPMASRYLTPRLSKDRDEIIMKFDELIALAEELCQYYKSQGEEKLPGDKYFTLRVSSVNLLTRLASGESIYVQELLRLTPNSFAIKGILEAARTDYLQGFMVDHKLLLSAEVFTDLLVQAEVLLEHDYKDAAAVIVRAVLEDGLRRLCAVHKVEADKRDTLQQLNEKLYKQHAYNLLLHKEIVAKAQIGNDAAHGRFSEYGKQDVLSFHEFVLRFLAEHLR